MKALIPPSPTQLSGAFITAGSDEFEILATRDKVVLIEFTFLSDAITWFTTHELMFCQRQHDPNTIKVIRPATGHERILFRIPLWIQGEEIPTCCGQPMFFIAQIDDDRLCTEPPKNAKLWWHDKASFYVFTCPQCLKCKTIAQQM